MTAACNISTVDGAFFQPLADLLATTPHARPCPELPDTDFVRLGIYRVLEASPSGRGFLQERGRAPELGRQAGPPGLALAPSGQFGVHSVQIRRRERQRFHGCRRTCHHPPSAVPRACRTDTIDPVASHLNFDLPDPTPATHTTSY
jgi:hypothetical protein